MFDVLIQQGYSMADIDSMDEETLFDIVQAKARLKELKEGKTEESKNHKSEKVMSLEDFIDGFDRK